MVRGGLVNEREKFILNKTIIDLIDYGQCYSWMC